MAAPSRMIAHSGHVPTANEMLGWIEHIVDRGIRRPGYPADDWTTEWCERFFHELDLDDVRLEEVSLPRWEPTSWLLLVWPTLYPDEAVEPLCFPLPHSAPAAGGLEGSLALMGTDVSGAVALDTVTLTPFRQTTARDLAMRSYDPDAEFDTLVQTLPFGRQIQNVMEPAIEAGAAGFIGIFDAPWESCDYYVPYDAVERPIPGVWVSRADGDRLRAMLGRGPVQARMTVESVREEVVSYNVVGSLPGASDDWVIIGSHHDGPWASAVEDASGVALVMAQAVYWSKVPRRERPHNLLFLVTSGHMAHGAGTAAFIAAHKNLLDSVVLELHLEHPARECVGIDGELLPTDAPEVRWWFTSRNEKLIDAVESAIRDEDLRRSLIMPPDVFGAHPTTDGGFFHTQGVPLVNFLTAPMYLFDSRDTVDKVHLPSLEPVSRAAIRIVESTRRTTPAEMRAGVITP
jgi:hypothetical protein